jgi:transcriptional repressor NrdR
LEFRREECEQVRCPFCREDDDRVIETRASDETIRRRRECLRCQRRFTTYERIERHPLSVIKKDGQTSQPWDRDKVRAGLARACEKRPVTPEVLDEAVDEIEREVHERYTTTVQSKAIGELVMTRLRAIDPVAYVRFASVYREFKDVSEFIREVRDVDRPRP